eukprot:TRINITY_DN1187_c0_g2_i4.p1 TRINITY_DN1187_c0_g2~~TRINITY_DN1187_c0_g2_i4.p1  ORF type:complete len:1891 (-),score=674.26 TRINITY_DN1187_c0_g2_i4:142-5814(-)
MLPYSFPPSSFSLFVFSQFSEDVKDSNDRRVVVVLNLAMIPVDFICYLIGIFNTVTIVRTYPMFRDLIAAGKPSESGYHSGTVSWDRRQIVAVNFMLVFVDLVCYLISTIIVCTLFRAYFLLKDLYDAPDANERRFKVIEHLVAWFIDVLCLPAFLIIICTIVRIPSMIYWLKNKEEFKSGVVRRLIVILHILLIPFDYFMLSLAILDVLLIWRAKKTIVELHQWFQLDPKEDRMFLEAYGIAGINFVMTIAELPVIALFLVLAATIYRLMDTLSPVLNATKSMQGGPSLASVETVRLQMINSTLNVKISAKKKNGNQMPVSDRVEFALVGDDAFWRAFEITQGSTAARLARLVMPYKLPLTWVDMTPYNDCSPGGQFELELNVPLGMSQSTLSDTIFRMDQQCSTDVNFHMGLPKQNGVLCCFKANLKTLRESLNYERDIVDANVQADSFVQEPEPFVFYQVFVINVLVQFGQLIIDLIMLTLALLTTCFIWRAPMLWGLLLEDASMFPKRLMARAYEDLRIQFRVKMPQTIKDMEKAKNWCKINTYKDLSNKHTVYGNQSMVQLYSINSYSELSGLLRDTMDTAINRGASPTKDPSHRMKSILEMKTLFDAFDVQLDTHYHVGHNIDHDTFVTYKEMLGNVEQMIDADIHHVVDEYYDLGKRDPISCGCGFKDRDQGTNRTIITLSLVSALLDLLALVFTLFLIFTLYRAKLFISRLKLGRGLSEKKKIVFGEIKQVGWDILALLTSVFLFVTLFKALDMITIWTDAWETGSMEEARFEIFELFGDFFADLAEALVELFCNCTNIGLCCASTCTALCVPGGLYFAVFTGDPRREDSYNSNWMRECCSVIFACGFWFFFTFFPFIYLYGPVAESMEGLAKNGNIAEVASSINTGMFTYIGLVFLLVLILLPSLGIIDGMTEFAGGADPANPPALNWANMNARIHLVLDTLQLCAFTFSVSDAIPFPLPVRETAKGGSSVALFDFGVTSTIAVFFLVFGVMVLWVYLTTFPITAQGIDIGDLDEKTFTDNSAWKLTIKMLTGTFFITILTNLLKVLRCVPVGNQLVMESDNGIPCWEGIHFSMALLAMLAISYFVPTATIVSAFFNEEKESDKLDYQFLHLYNIMLNIMKMFLSAALFFLADNIWAYLVVLLILNLLMLAITAGFPMITDGKHVCVYPSFANWRASTFAAGAWSTICSMWALAANDENDYVSAYALLVGWALIFIVTFVVNIFVKKAIQHKAREQGFLPRKELIQMMFDLRDRVPTGHFLEQWKEEGAKWEKATKKSAHPKSLGRQLVALLEYIEIGAFDETAVINKKVRNQNQMDEIKSAKTNAAVAQVLKQHLDALNPRLVADIESGATEQAVQEVDTSQRIFEGETQVDGHKRYMVVYRGVLRWFNSKKDFEKGKEMAGEMKTEHMLRVWMGDSVAMFGMVSEKHAFRHIIIDTTESEHILDCSDEHSAHDFYNAILEAGWHQVTPGLDVTEPIMYAIGLSTGTYKEGTPPEEETPVVVNAVPVTDDETPVLVDAKPVRNGQSDDDSSDDSDSDSSVSEEESEDVEPMLQSSTGGGKFGKLFGAATNLASKNANLKDLMDKGQKIYSEGKKLATDVRQALEGMEESGVGVAVSNTVNTMRNKITSQNESHMYGILLMNRYLAEKWIALSSNGNVKYDDGISVSMGSGNDFYVGTTALFERSFSMPIPAEFGWDNLYVVLGMDMGDKSNQHTYVDGYVVEYFNKPPRRLLLEDEHVENIVASSSSSTGSINSSKDDVAMETIHVEGGDEEIELESTVSEATRREEFADEKFWASMINMHEHPEQMAKFLGRYMHTESLECPGKRFMTSTQENAKGRAWFAFDVTNLRGRMCFLRFIIQSNADYVVDRVFFTGDVEELM